MSATCNIRLATAVILATFVPGARSTGWQTAAVNATRSVDDEKPLAPLMAPPIEWVTQMTPVYRADANIARMAYLRMLSSLLTGLSYECDPLAPVNELMRCIAFLRQGKAWGKQLSPYATSMAGLARMKSLSDQIARVSEMGLKGAYAELGTWRGGMSIYATAALQLHGLADRRVYLCDSFEGLPAPSKNSLRPDEAFYRKQVYLNVRGPEIVLANFVRYGVPHDQVRAVKGFFVDSMPRFRKDLQANGEVLAILRLDGDMYDSTIDALYNLYDLVEIGGFIVIDDFGWDRNTSFGARDAVIDFRALHSIEDADHTMRPTDHAGAWWTKQREVTLRRDLYLRARDTKADRAEATRLLRPPNSAFSESQYHDQLRLVWEGRMRATEMRAYNALSRSPEWDRAEAGGRGDHHLV